MVTAGPPVIVRVPHPLQSGALPAALWILRRVLNLTLTLGILWAIPAAIADYPSNVTIWVAVILGSVIGVTVASRVLARIEQTFIPGGLRWYSKNEVPRRSWVPTIAADLVAIAAILVALPHLLSRSDNYGIFAGTLAMMGGGMLGLATVYAVVDAWRRLPGWKQGLALGLVGSMPLAIMLSYAGLVAAPDPNRAAPMCFWLGAIIVAGFKLFEAIIRPTGKDLSEGLEEVADALSTRANIAPTLRDRARSRTKFDAALASARAKEAQAEERND